MKTNFLKGLFAVAAGALMLGVTGCKKDGPDGGYKVAEINTYLDGAVDNNIVFDEIPIAGDEYTFQVKSNRAWEITSTIPEALTVTPTKGDADKTVSVTVEVAANPAGEPGRNFDLKFAVSDTKSISQTVKFRQLGEGGTTEDYEFDTTNAIWWEDAGSTVSKVNDYWPGVDEYTGYSKGGTIDQSAVTYTGNASVRNSGKGWDSPELGSTAPYFYLGANKSNAQPLNINVIDLDGKTNFTLSWIMQDTDHSVDGANGYECVPRDVTTSTVKVEGSFNGTSFAPITYTVGQELGLGWTAVTAEFSVPAGTENLYLRLGDFTAASDQGLRLDNFKIEEGGNGTLLDPENVVVPPAFGVSTTTVSVSSTAGDASVNVTGNVAWTAAIATNGANATIKSGATGTAPGTVTLTFPENTADTEKVTTVTISTTEAATPNSYTVTFTQARAGGDTVDTSLLFPGSDFNNWSAFSGALNSYGLTNAEESETGGRDGSGALYIGSTPTANAYVFTALQPAPAPAISTSISFWIKGTTATKSLSMNVYKANGTNYHCFNLENCTSDVTLTASSGNSDAVNGTNGYNGTINTGGNWVKVTLDVAGLSINTGTTGNIFALKVGKESAYDLYVDDITFE